MNLALRILWRVAPRLCSRWMLRSRRRRLSRVTFLGSDRAAARADDSVHETLSVDRTSGGLIRRRRSLDAFIADAPEPECDHEWHRSIGAVLAKADGPLLCRKCHAELDLPPKGRP